MLCLFTFFFSPHAVRTEAGAFVANLAASPHLGCSLFTFWYRGTTGALETRATGNQGNWKPGQPNLREQLGFFMMREGYDTGQ